MGWKERAVALPRPCWAFETPDLRPLVFISSKLQSSARGGRMPNRSGSRGPAFCDYGLSASFLSPTGPDRDNEGHEHAKQ
jgi:hypothetical protein